MKIFLIINQSTNEWLAMFNNFWLKSTTTLGKGDMSGKGEEEFCAKYKIIWSRLNKIIYKLVNILQCQQKVLNSQLSHRVLSPISLIKSFFHGEFVKLLGFYKCHSDLLNASRYRKHKTKFYPIFQPLRKTGTKSPPLSVRGRCYFSSKFLWQQSAFSETIFFLKNANVTFSIRD